VFAVRQFWVVMSINALGAAIERSPTARAAIAFVRSAMAEPGRNGSKSVPLNCYRLSTSMWFSRCPKGSRRWRSRTSGRSMASCSAPPPKRFCSSAPTQDTWALAFGFPAVLHTWGQNLNHHPHLHCVVPGRGIALDQRRWISCRRQFFFGQGTQPPLRGMPENCFPRWKARVSWPP
jgi:Putative transposase